MPMATTSSAAAATATAATAPSSSASTLSGGGGASTPLINPNAAQFREIHKNTWLKRLTAEGKKITVGPKKSDRSWVVFCVHDDTEALLEGYAEPRQAASHSPEWIVTMQDTLHISHALIPNSHEFEFVVTLANEVIRFHAMSWEIMQEWVETLRSKLREMKILSPRENLYTKLPEIRAPLLPTRDPTSPLPAPPPVPAAMVPGVERIVPPTFVHDNSANEARPDRPNSTSAPTMQTTATTTTSQISSLGRTYAANNATAAATTTSIEAWVSNTPATIIQTTITPSLTAMSNTLTQNLLNMLSDPISAYSEQLNGVAHIEDTISVDDANEMCYPSMDFEDELLSPVLRKSLQIHENNATTTTTANTVRVDVSQRASADQIKNWDGLMQTENVISSRFQTSRSLSAGAADTSRKHIAKPVAAHNDSTTSSSDNITALEISSEATQTLEVAATFTPIEQVDVDKMNITIIQVSTHDSNELKQPAETKPGGKMSSKRVTGEIFKFPETIQLEYKSNVQIIPSTKANSSTIQVLGTETTTTAPATPHATPVKRTMQTVAATTAAGVTLSAEELKIVTVHVTGDLPAVTTGTTAAQDTGQTTAASGTSMYGTCFSTQPQSYTTQHATMASNVGAGSNGTPKMSKKIILSANTSGITNITVNNASTVTRSEVSAAADAGVKHNVGSVHYEKVFLSTSVPPPVAATTTTAPTGTLVNSMPPLSPTLTTLVNAQSHKRLVEATSLINNGTAIPSSPTPLIDTVKQNKTTTAMHTIELPSLPPKCRNNSMQSPAMPRAHPSKGSPALDRRRIASPTNILMRPAASSSPPPAHQAPTEKQSPLPLPSRGHLLTRGLTEAVITARPSRRDFHCVKAAGGKVKSQPINGGNIVGMANKSGAPLPSNNNGDSGSSAQSSMTASNSTNAPHPNRNRNCEILDQRRRSSSTSDARAASTRGTNNNEVPGVRNAALRFQQPPQPFRNAENVIANGSSGGSTSGVGNNIGISSPPPPPCGAASSPANKRMTLREHQVIQLRREIMHPGGVRLQLRRKDCVGSIAWVDAFGAVWVAGWKQKEHPVLYNALHIGDQLLSIAGQAISAASEANKIIRNNNTLFVEVLVRRMPFGRGYAIRREREGQCLGLIRDGNTATIVDVVPNSLAARHGLPPKAQSCDGTTLTFWVLTEINGRPLNLYFKDNEIRDRLNSVGRDISILVQPSDLITKLKKQLKSLRSYKDYLVQ